jgi:hypothetical protein
MPPDPPGMERMHVCWRPTGFRCKQCGHWNDLKRRKGYAEWDAQRVEARHG